MAASIASGTEANGRRWRHLFNEKCFNPLASLNTSFGGLLLPPVSTGFVNVIQLSAFGDDIMMKRYDMGDGSTICSPIKNATQRSVIKFDKNSLVID